MPTARWQQIHDDLKDRIVSGDLAPQDPLPSDVDLAADYGVSRLTAHRALYELQRAGLVVRKRKTGTVVADPKPVDRITVAAVFFNLSQRFEAALLSSLTTAFGDDVRVNVVETRHDPRREAEVLCQLRDEVSAIVLFPTCAPENSELLRSLCDADYPLVCIDRYPEGIPCDSVLTDNYGAASEGMRRLLQNGHRSVAHLTDFETYVPSTADRMRAYVDVMEENGLDPRRLIRSFPYITPNSAREYGQALQLVHDSLHSMLNGPEPPTALFCLRDLYAAAAMEAAEKLGYRVPEDLEILAFLDRQSLLLRRPESVLRIHQDLDQIGRIAVERLRARLAGRALPRGNFLVPATFHGYEAVHRV